MAKVVRLLDPDAGIDNDDDELNEALTLRAYYRDFDVPDCKNDEAVAKAELNKLVFYVKRVLHVKGVRDGDEHIDKVVAAVEKATITTARRMKREDTLRGYEKRIADLQKKGDE